MQIVLYSGFKTTYRTCFLSVTKSAVRAAVIENVSSGKCGPRSACCPYMPKNTFPQSAVNILLAAGPIIIGPVHDKTYKMTCAPSEDSDQPGHPPRLIRVLAVCLNITKTRLFKYTVNSTTKKMKIFRQKTLIFFIFLLKT